MVDSEGISKLYKEVAQMPMAPTPGTLSSLSQSTLTISWVIPYDQLTEEKKIQVWLTAWFMMILHTMQAFNENGPWQHYSPFLGYP